MHQIQISDQAYQEAERRAAQAGFSSVDAFVTDVLEQDLASGSDNFDARFTPEVNAYLERVAADMQAGRHLSLSDMEKRLNEVQGEWLKNHAG